MPRKSGRSKVRRCSVKKLFQAIDKDGSGTVSLTEVKKAFAKAAGSDKVLTYAEMQKACRKYAGNMVGDACESEYDCPGSDEYCDTYDEVCRSIHDTD